MSSNFCKLYFPLVLPFLFIGHDVVAIKKKGFGIYDWFIR